VLCANEEAKACKIPRIAYPHRKRIRKSVVNQIMDELGPTHTRRAYHMTAASFYILFRLLEPFLEGPPHPWNGPKGGKNGAVSGELRSSAAIRHFARGSSDDICLVHGASHSEVFNSVWKIVDAVNLCDELAFKCPASHEEQKKIAEGFLAKSHPGFMWCAGTIDCMLVWIEKPTETQCVEASVGCEKWFCGRKKRFGIPPQGTCDVEGRFLDAVMEHPASTSDFLAFATWPLHHKLEVQGLPAEGSCFFGNNVHVNCRHMASPCHQEYIIIIM